MRRNTNFPLQTLSVNFMKEFNLFYEFNDRLLIHKEALIRQLNGAQL